MDFRLSHAAEVIANDLVAELNVSL